MLGMSFGVNEPASTGSDIVTTFFWVGFQQCFHRTELCYEMSIVQQCRGAILYRYLQNWEKSKWPMKHKYIYSLRKEMQKQTSHDTTYKKWLEAIPSSKSAKWGRGNLSLPLGSREPWGTCDVKKKSAEMALHVQYNFIEVTLKCNKRTQSELLTVCRQHNFSNWFHGQFQSKLATF